MWVICRTIRIMKVQFKVVSRQVVFQLVLFDGFKDLVLEVGDAKHKYPKEIKMTPTCICIRKW